MNKSTKLFFDTVEKYKSNLMTIEKVEAIDIKLEEHEKDRYYVLYGHSYGNFYIHKMLRSELKVWDTGFGKLLYSYTKKEQYLNHWFDAQYSSYKCKHEAIEKHNKHLNEMIRIFQHYLTIQTEFEKGITNVLLLWRKN